MTSAFQLTYVPLCLTLFVVVTTGRAEIATAPVDGAINLAAPNVQKKDVLNVNSGQKVIRSKSTRMIQGDPDCIVNEKLNQGAGDIHVADVFDRAGDSLFEATGDFLPNENPPAGGNVVAKKDWNSAFNSGNPRILLEVNGPGTADNRLSLPGLLWNPPIPAVDGTLTVRVAGAAAGDVDITFDQLPPNGGRVAGDVIFPITLTGPYDKAILDIRAEKSGSVDIEAKSDKAEKGSVKVIVTSPDDLAAN